jgi:hypothetical protein
MVRANLNHMAVIQKTRIGGVDSELVDQVKQLAGRRGVDERELINAALRKLLEDPEVRAELEERAGRAPLPPAAGRVYRQLCSMYSGLGPIRSQALADALGIHRGNVDRHLGLMRELGYARRDGHGHVPIFEADGEVAQAS